MNHLHMHKCRHAFIEAHTQTAGQHCDTAECSSWCVYPTVCVFVMGAEEDRGTEGVSRHAGQLEMAAASAAAAVRIKGSMLVSDKHWISAVIWPLLTPALNQDLELYLTCVEERCSHLPGLTQSGVGPHEDLWPLIP